MFYLVKYSSSSLVLGLATVNIFQLMSTWAKSRIRTDCMATGIGFGYPLLQLTITG